MPAPLNTRTMRRRRAACRVIEVALRIFPKDDRATMDKAIKAGIRGLFADHIEFVDAFEGIPTKPRTIGARP